MARFTRFIKTKLELKVNEQKSAVARPSERSLWVLVSRRIGKQNGGSRRKR
jgi:hypothetical protein